MCTLILGLGILGPGSILAGANRDESPERPSSGPDVLVDSPRVVGGRDLLSRGTWLAIREGRFAAALMNRRPAAGAGAGGGAGRSLGDAAGRSPGDSAAPTSFRSRGLLCLDVAADDGGHDSFLTAALAEIERNPYAPCTLVGAGIDGEAWALRAGLGDPEVRPISRGWHVITHQDLDDRDEPRTRYLLDALAREAPAGVDEGVELLTRLLRLHAAPDTPAVCIHREVFPTVSSSILVLGVPNGGLYLHAQGPPCVTEYRDFTGILPRPR